MTYQHLPLPLHVAIIDDRTEEIRLLGQAFAELQYHVRISSADSVRSATQLLDELASQCDCPDLVFIDLRLGSGSGFEVLQHLRQAGILVTTPIVTMTSQPQDGDLACATALGACDLQIKPHSLEDLLTQVSRTISIHCPFQLAGRDAN